MKLLSIFLTGVIFFTLSIPEAVSETTNMETEHEILLKIDQAMAEASSENGILSAFYAFMDHQAVLLPSEGYPIYGASACEKLVQQVPMDDWKGRLSWEPLWAYLSDAKDLGYTYGRFEIPVNESSDEADIAYRYYFTIWKKNKNETWKVAFSHGLILLSELNQTPVEEDHEMEMDDLDAVTKEVVAVEREFYEYCKVNGIPESFHHFMAEEGVVLGSSGKPRTKAYYAEWIASSQGEEDTGRSELIWWPVYSHVSASKELAYNYGPSKYIYADAHNNLQVSCCYFVTVWKKQADGQWKFLIDGGNSSPCHDD